MLVVGKNGWWLLTTILIGVACNGDEAIAEKEDDGGSDGSSDGGDGGSGACESDEACGSGQICEAGDCVDGDRNNSPEEAESLRFGDGTDGPEGQINPAGDLDFYAFEADGGEYIRVSTITAGEDEEGTYDTVVSIERANGKLITVADEFATGSGVGGVDSVAFAYIDEPGTYYVVVQDVGSYYEDPENPEEGARDYTYQVNLMEWDAKTSEPDSAESPLIRLNLTEDRIWTSIGALIDEAGDVDHIGLELGLDGYDLYLDGNRNLDGSDVLPRVALRSVDTGELFLSRVSFGPEGTAFFPALPAGEYAISLDHAEGGGGANDWMFLHVIARETDTSFQAEEEVNDSPAGATPLEAEELETSSGNTYTIARLSGLADLASDEDWFEFEVGYEGAEVVTCLNAGWYGALSAPNLEIYDAGGALLAEGPGLAGLAYPNAAIDGLFVDPGTYHLRVVHPESASGGAGEWYRAYIYVAAFEVDSYACP
jgi:hypothetical protein